jgi:two-component system capsular synthesis response regulator RcsB
MANIRVIVADDHPFVLLGMRSAVSVHRDITIVGEATNPTSLIELLRSVPCDVLVTDLTMPESSDATGDGLGFVRYIRHEWPALGVVVLTSLTNTAILRSAVVDHAVSILNKTGSMTELIAAIRSASIGRLYVGRSVHEALEASDDARLEPDAAMRRRHLTSRESEVIGMFVRGKSISEIALALGRDVRIVSRQKRVAMTKLGVTTEPGLYAYIKANSEIL